MGFPIEIPKDSNILVSKSCEIKSYVSKPIEQLKYSSNVDYKSIVTNYFESAELNSSKNLILEDNSTNYHFNDRRNLDERSFENLGNVSKFDSKYKNILLTYFVGLGRDSESLVPLFYKQKKDPTKKIKRVNVELITNANTVPVNYGNSIVDGEFYYNYENSFDPITKEYNVYMLNITYTDNTSEQSIINPIEAIEESSFESRNNLRYSKLKKASGYEYSVLFPENQTFAAFKCSTFSENANLDLYVKNLSKNSIYLKLPENQPVENEWIVEVVNGEVYNIESNFIYKYSVPEYKKQPFSKEAPLLEVFDKDCYQVTEKIIKIPFEEVKYVPGNFDIKLYRYDLNNEKIDNNPLSINSVNEKQGFVELENSLNLQEDVYIRASFYYKTETYYYKLKNFNPYYNKDIINNKYHFYIKPNEDSKSLQVYNEKEHDLALTGGNINNSWLYLGAVFYEEKNDLEDSFSFYLNNNKRYYDWETVLNKNPYLLQSKYFYGENGQSLQKNNIVIVDLPSKYETHPDYTEAELYSLFKMKLKSTTNVIFNYQDDEPKLKIKSYLKSTPIITCSWEGPGVYKLLKKGSNGKFSELMNQSVNNIEQGQEYFFDFDLTPYVNSLNSIDTFKIEYNSIVSKREYQVKWED